jgi:hypothetical protein
MDALLRPYKDVDESRLLTNADEQRHEYGQRLLDMCGGEGIEEHIVMHLFHVLLIPFSRLKLASMVQGYSFLISSAFSLFPFKCACTIQFALVSCWMAT